MSSDDDDEEEDDYMSDKWLNQLVLMENKLKADSEKKIELKSRGRTKHASLNSQTSLNRAELEKKRREEGLSMEIQEQNRGYELLAKMGYQKGMSLGRSDRSGLMTPIKIDFRQNRMGLGLELELKKREDQIALRLKEQEETTSCDYRTRLSQRFAEKQLLSDFSECRNICEQLDRARGIEENEIWSYERCEDESFFEPGNLTKNLRKMIDYLRESYQYCHWCGVSYRTNDELESLCPGPDKEDH